MEGSKVVPALAVSWKALDSLTWEFKLRKGVKFHNGEAFDSGSIKATFDAFFTQRTEPFVRLRTVDKNGYSAPDPETFIIKTTTPDGILPAKLSQVIVLPAKYYAEKGIDGFKAAPVGTGPFQFASYERDKQISFKAFSGSWSGTPKIADLTFKLIPDVATQVQALKAGEVDLIALSTKDQYDDLKAKGFKVYNTLIGSTTVVDLKTIDGGPLADKRVRQALNLAINKTELTQGIFGDLTEAATQTFSPQAFGYNPEIKPDSYDPEKARALLKEAGIKEGELNLSIPYLSGRVGGKETLEALTQYLAKVGIKVEAQPLESATYFAKYQKNELAPAAIIARVYAPQLDGLLAVEWFTKDFGSLQRYNNDTLNTLYRQALGEPDNTKREALVKQASRLLVEDYASIPLYYGFEIFATSTKVEGFKPSSNGYLILDKVTKTS
jgi:peptide/nickel transport system substrate-binding protein